jgi:NitT/TauT family transport system substrate-binding protein
VPSTTRRNVLWALALVAALGLVAVAFVRGSDGDDDDAADIDVDSSTAPSEPDDPGEGCGPASLTDHGDLSASRVVARCGPGAPAAQPLVDTATIRVAVTRRTEAAAPVLVADQLGEFTAEGLDVEIVDQPAPDAFAALAADDVDVVVGPIDAPFFDAADDGTGVRLVLGGPLSTAPNDTDVPQAGLWFRSDLVSRADRWDDLANMQVALADGMRSAATYPVTTVFDQGGLTLNEVDLIDASGDEAATALLDQEVAAAWLDQPAAWTRVADADGYELAVTLPASESIDGSVMSQRLLGDDRDVGLAYARAVIRTMNTHLTGDYRDDEEVMAALAEATGTSADDLSATPALLFDWELRAGTTDRMQDAMIDLGSVAYERPMPEDDLVDRTLTLDAIGLRARDG